MSKEAIDYAYFARKLGMQLKVYCHPLSQNIFSFLDTHGKTTVSHLQEHLGLGQSFLSQRLTKLRTLGFLNIQKDSRHVYYFINKKKMQVFQDFLKTYFEVL